MDIKYILHAGLSVALLLMLYSAGMSAQFELKRPFHPRLNMTPDELQADRADQKAVEEARRLGDSQLRLDRTTSYKDYFIPLPQAPFPNSHKGDSWPYWTGLCGNLRRYLENLSYAYAVTGDQRFYDACYATMMSICNWPQWTDPDYSNGKYPCLDTHSLVRGVTTAYDYLYEDLSQADRQKVRTAIVEKGCERVFPYVDEGWVSNPNQWPNGYAIVHTAMAVGALAVMGEVEGVEKYLARAIEKMSLYFDQQGGQDGGLIEGFGYGSVAVDNFMYLIETTNAVTGVNLFDHRYLSQAIYFPAYFVLPGGGSVANFGDNGGSSGCTPTLTAMANAMVKINDSTLAAWYLVKADKPDEQARALAEQPDDLPLARKFRSIRWAAFRSGWASDDSLLAFKCGFVKNHNHLDQNHFILGYGRHWVINDPGYQIYNRPYPAERKMSMELIKSRHDYTFGTYGHNSILVDGEQQLSAEGEIGDLFSTPAMCYTVGDATACYADRLSKYLRHVISVPGGYYLILDEVAARDADRSVEILLHTPSDGEFMVSGEALSENQTTDAAFLAIRRATAQVAVDMLGPQKLSIAHKIWPHSAGYGHYISCSTGDSHAEFTNLMALRAGPAAQHFAPLQGALEVAQDGLFTINIMQQHGPDIIAIGAGEHPSTGSVRHGSPQAGQAGGLSHDGAIAMTSHPFGHRYAICRGTELTFRGDPLVRADAPVTVGGVLRDGVFRAAIVADQPVTVTMHTPVRTALARISGIEQPLDASFDTEAQLLTLALQPGRYLVELRQL